MPSRRIFLVTPGNGTDTGLRCFAMGNLSTVNGDSPDTRLRRWLVARRERLTEQRLVDSTLLRLQGDWDPTPAQYLAARAAAARHLRVRRSVGLIGLVLVGLAVVIGAALGTIFALPGGSQGHGLAVGPPKTVPMPGPLRRSTGSEHRSGSHGSPVVPPASPVPVHSSRARPTSIPAAVAGTASPVPTASVSPSPSPSPTKACTIRLLGLCL